MVKMDNIERNGNVISMDCYEEGDLNRAHHVIFDVSTLESSIAPMHQKGRSESSHTER